MRVALIGHTYVAAANRGKLAELAAHSDLDLHVIVPTRWRETLGSFTARSAGGQAYDLRALGVLLSGRNHHHLYASPSLHLARLRPDVVHVEEEPGSLVMLQALFARKVFAPRAKLLFFTWENLPRSRPFPHPQIERIARRSAEGAIVGNREARGLLREQGFTQPTEVIPQLGVDLNVFQRAEGTALRGRLRLRPFVVGFIGRFVPAKGLHTLLEAFRGLDDDVSLLMVGSGPMETALSNGGGARVRVVGRVAHAEVASYLNAMDVLVLPSLTTPTWKEQFGHVLIEAMACEVPVIGSDSGEIPNVIDDAGLVVPEGDAAELRAALQRVRHDDGLRTRMARRGRQRVLENYTDAAIAARTHRMYRALLRS